MHAKEDIYRNLEITLTMLDKQFDATMDFLARQIEALPYGELTSAYDMRGPDGNHILLPLLIARTNCLAAMASLAVAKD